MTYYIDFDRTIFDTETFKKRYGTYGGFVFRHFEPQELRKYLYPDVVGFLEEHGKDVVIVTYGIREFIRAKVRSALADLPVKKIRYTAFYKGRILKRVTKYDAGPYRFIDDAVFQLASVALMCPTIDSFEMRRDGGAGDGRWPVVRSLRDIPKE